MEKKWIIGVVVLQAASLATIAEMSYRLHLVNAQQETGLIEATSVGCDLKTQDDIKELASKQQYEFDDLRRRVIATNEAAHAANETAHSINKTTIIRDLTRQNP